MKKTTVLKINSFWLAAISLALLTLIFFHAVLLGDGAFYLVDLSTLEIPNHLWMKAHVGELWNFTLVTGQPHFANSQTYSFDLLHNLSLLLPPLFGFHFYVICHFWVAGIGFWLLLRKWGLSPTTALFGAVIFTYGGFFISLGHLVLILNVVTYVPWALWSHTHTIDARHWKSALFWTAITAMILMLEWFGGDPHFVMMTVLILFFLPFGGVGSERGHRPLWIKLRREVSRASACLAIAVIWSMLLACIQLVPFFEFLSYSNRKAVLSFAEATRWSFEPRTLLSLLFPHELMNLDAKKAWGFGYWEHGMPYIWSVHLGVVAFAAALFAVFSRDNRRAFRPYIYFAAILIVSGIFLALGKFNPFYSVLYSILPPLQHLRFPEKFFFLAHLGLVILACFGIEAFTKQVWKNSQPLKILAGIFLGLALFWMAISPIIAESFADDSFWKLFFPLKLLVTLCGLALICGILGVTQPGKKRSYLLLALATFELWYAHRHLNPTLPEEVYKETAAVQWAQAEGLHTSPYRLMTMPIGRTIGALGRATDLPFYYREIIESLQPQMGIAFDLADINSSNSLHLTSLDTFRAFFKKDSLKALSLFSIRYVWSPYDIDFPGLKLLKNFEGDPQTFIYEYDDALPRAYLVSNWQSIDNEDELFQKLLEKNFNQKEKALLTETAPFSANEKIQKDFGQVTDWQQYGDEISLKVEVKENALLVLTESFYPGWRAFVDKQPVNIVKTNGLFQGIFLEAGKHQVLFTYRPYSLATGFLISLWASLGWLGSLALTLNNCRVGVDSLQNPQPRQRRERTKKKKSRPA